MTAAKKDPASASDPNSCHQPSSNRASAWRAVHRHAFWPGVKAGFSRALSMSVEAARRLVAEQRWLLQAAIRSGIARKASMDGFRRHSRIRRSRMQDVLVCNRGRRPDTRGAKRPMPSPKHRAGQRFPPGRILALRTDPPCPNSNALFNRDGAELQCGKAPDRAPSPCVMRLP